MNGRKYDFTGQREIENLKSRVLRLYGQGRIDLIQHNVVLLLISRIQLSIENSSFAIKEMEEHFDSQKNYSEEATST